MDPSAGYTSYTSTTNHNYSWCKDTWQEKPQTPVLSRQIYSIDDISWCPQHQYKQKADDPQATFNPCFWTPDLPGSKLGLMLNTPCTSKSQGCNGQISTHSAVYLHVHDNGISTEKYNISYCGTLLHISPGNSSNKGFNITVEKLLRRVSFDSRKYMTY